MADVPEQPDLLISPEQASSLPVGTIRGPAGWDEGFGAGLIVYIGEGQWRPMGDLLQAKAGLILHKGGLSAGLSWDLGACKLNWAKKDDKE